MNLFEQIRARARARKQISHRPDLAGRVHVIQQRGNAELPQLENYLQYAEVYQAYVWVRKAMTLIHNAIAPLRVMVVDGKGEEIDDHPLTTLYAHANDTNSGHDLWGDWIIYKMLGGEVFFDYVTSESGELLEVWSRRPDRMVVYPDTSPERALYPRVAGYGLKPHEDIVIPPEIIWHDKFLNPLNKWRGLPIIQAVRNSIVIDAFAQSWSKNLLKKGARPDYVFVAPQGITPTEREEIELQLAEKFGGIDNAHKPIVLEDEIMDVKVLNFTPADDVAWLEQRKFSRDEIGGIFGVPDVLMGYGPESYDNAEKMTANLTYFWTLTIKPLVDARDISLQNFHTKTRQDLGENEFIKTDLSQVGVLQEDLLPKIERAERLWQMGVPFDILDERLGLGIGSIPGGDTGYLPFNLAPADSLAMPQPAPTNEPPIDLNVIGEIVKQTIAEINTNHRLTDIEKNGPTGIEYGSQKHWAIWKQHDRLLNQHERLMQRNLKKSFQEQQNDALRAIREHYKSTKAQIDIPTTDEIFNMTQETARLDRQYRVIFADTIESFGRAQLDALGVSVAFDVSNPLVESYIRERTFRFANDINETTQQRIGDVLREIGIEANQEGLSIPEIQRRVHDDVSQVFNVRKSDYETERIARTETNRNASAGNMSAGRQAREAGLNLVKAWLASLDGRERDTHREAHRRYQADPISLDDDFQVGACSGDGPGLTGCANEDINCRCTVTFEELDD